MNGLQVPRGPGAVEIFASPEDLARAALQAEIGEIRARLDAVEAENRALRAQIRRLCELTTPSKLDGVCTIL